MLTPRPVNPMLRTALYRPVWLPATILAALLLLTLGLLVSASSRSVERFSPIERHLTQIRHLQRVEQRMLSLLLRHLDNGTTVSHDELRALQRALAGASRNPPDLLPDTPERLQEVQTALTAPTTDTESTLSAALQNVRAILREELDVHERLTARANEAARAERNLAIAALIALPLFALAMLLLVSKRVLMPLRDLNRLIGLLARRDYSSADTTGADPMLKPLLDNYNELVGRLQALEHENAARQRSLESQVHKATAELLEQQRALANTERLAAVGELTASLAHELRNPLAGMEVALTNLHKQVTTPNHAQRLGLVLDELSRVTGLLNGLLDQSRHVPEPAESFPLAQAVKDLLLLASYQVPDQIRLDHDIPASLGCHLPRHGLHQVLLNLALNAREAIGDGPGTIVIKARVADAKLTLSVCDTGPGFPEQMVQYGIRPFASARQGGTGLGLAMVQRFVHNLDGEIQLRNRQPHGACVTLVLPCQDAQWPTPC